MVDFINHMLAPLVDVPEDIVVSEKHEQGIYSITIYLSEKESRKIAGAKGRVARAIKTLIQQKSDQERVWVRFAN